jgi:anhydro-N-acetylmuramic acid kinase
MPDFSTVHQILHEAVGADAAQHRVAPAAQLAVRWRGRLVFSQAYGWLDPGARTRPVTRDTRFDLASITKLFTTTAFLALVEEGRAALDEPISSVLPEFHGLRPIRPYENPLDWDAVVDVSGGAQGTVDAGAITFRQALTHVSGLPAWRPLHQAADVESARRMALETFFAYPPGAGVVYSDVGLILLGMAVERLAGLPLDEVVRQRVTAPLGIARACFLPVGGPLPQNTAPTEFCAWRGRRVVGEVHDENAYRLGGVAGHAGIFADAEALAVFGQSFLASSSGGVALLRPDTVAEMRREQARDGATRRGVGFHLWSPDPQASSHPFSPETFGHTGFTGVCLWVDPERELVVALLTNEVYNGRADRGIGPLRVAVAQAVVDAVDAVPAASLDAFGDLAAPGGAAATLPAAGREIGRPMQVVGLMSGTSADGTDAVLVELRGQPPALQWKVLAHTHRPHPPALRDEIFACFRPESGSVDRLCALNFALGHAFAEAALEVIAAAGRTPAEIDLIGSHGQTVWHIPEGCSASTLQLGAPAVIAERTGIPVIADFRARDMAAGGQGAPLVALVDALLFRADCPRALQNIGGIANVTYLPAVGSAGAPFAFDTGPGNMLIDDAARRATEGALDYDRDGAMAARGAVHAGLLEALLADPYFAQRPPKTTGRERFGSQYGAQVWARAGALGISADDLLATLTAFTAQSIAQAYRDFLPEPPAEVIVSGGGAHNPVLMEHLARALPGVRLLRSSELGLDVEAKEAVAFAVLAYESFHGRPGNLPAATGAARPVVLGSVTPGRTALALPEASQSQAGALQLDAPGPAQTEARNPRTLDIDQIPTLEMLRRINAEDRRVPEAVALQLPAIAEAVDRIAERMQRGGRLIYMGAGTSGRLGLVDASECPPTYNTPPSLVIGLIAGGTRAFTEAVEGGEDNAEAGARDLQRLDVGPNDTVVGLAASGRTPYVIGGLEEARQRGALTVSLACNHPSALEAVADIAIHPVVGPEAIAGSTRMKAGTAQKMVLNLLSTGVMVRLGKTYSNLMVDVQATNKKLRQRARRIVAEACGIAVEEAAAALDRCDGEVKTAIVAHLGEMAPEEARARLQAAGGVTRAALEAARAR